MQTEQEFVLAQMGIRSSKEKSADPPGEPVSDYPALPSAIEQEVRGAPLLLISDEVVKRVARRQMWCPGAKLMYPVDVFERVTDGDLVRIASLCESLAPAVARSARRAAVRYGHAVWAIFFILAGLVTCALTPIAWQDRVLSLVTYAVASALIWGWDKVSAQARTPKAPKSNFVSGLTARIIIRSALALACFVAPFPAFVSVGVGMAFAFSASWLLFSYACAMYGAEGPLGGTPRDQQGFALIAITLTWHHLRYHNGPDGVRLLGAKFEEAGHHTRLAITRAARNGSPETRAEAELLGRATEASFVKHAVALRVSPSYKSRARAFQFLSRAIEAIAIGDWTSIATPGVVPAPQLAQAPLGQRFGPFVVQLIPAVAAAALWLWNPEWLRSANAPYVGFILVIVTTAVLNLLWPRARATDAVANTASSATLTQH